MNILKKMMLLLIINQISCQKLPDKPIARPSLRVFSQPSAMQTMPIPEDTLRDVTEIPEKDSIEEVDKVVVEKTRIVPSILPQLKAEKAGKVEKAEKKTTVSQTRKIDVKHNVTASSTEKSEPAEKLDVNSRVMPLTLDRVLIEARAHYDSAVHYYSKHEYIEALQHIDRSLFLNIDGSAHILRSKILIAQKKWSAAVTAAERGIASSCYLVNDRNEGFRTHLIALDSLYSNHPSQIISRKIEVAREKYEKQNVNLR